MIKLSNGHILEYVTASGALGFYGEGWPWEWPLIRMGLIDPSLFTNFTKTTTFDSWKGNLRWYAPWRCVRIIKDGTVNAVGLTNPGFRKWFLRIKKKQVCEKYNIAASINFDDDCDHIRLMAIDLNRLNLKAVELNVMCPNFTHESDAEKFQEQAIRVCKTIKKYCRHPLIIKLSEAIPMQLAIVLAPFAEAFSINSVRWKVVFPDKKSPLAGLGGGGVSGKAAQRFTWDYAYRLIHKTGVPVIGPSVWDYDDMNQLDLMGAKAISFGAVHVRYPTRPTIFVRRRKYEKKEGLQINPQTLAYRDH